MSNAATTPSPSVSPHQSPPTPPPDEPPGTREGSQGLRGAGWKAEDSEEEMDPKTEAAAAAGVPEALRAEREWTDISGRKLKATVTGFADEAKRVLKVRRSDGRVFELPVERLSEKDRGFLSDALDGD